MFKNSDSFRVRGRRRAWYRDAPALPLLLLIARSMDIQMAAQLEFLKAENEMLRRRLPKRIYPKHAEWELLLTLVGRIESSAVRALTSPLRFSSRP